MDLNKLSIACLKASGLNVVKCTRCWNIIPRKYCYEPRRDLFLCFDCYYDNPLDAEKAKEFVDKYGRIS